jgi:hypothetical protein
MAVAGSPPNRTFHTARRVLRSANKYLLQEAAQWTLVGVALLACVYFF